MSRHSIKLKAVINNRDSITESLYDKLDLVMILFILFLWEWIGILNELRYSIITDWSVIIAPLLWINITVPFLYYLLKKLLIQGNSRVGVKMGRLAKYFQPDFTNLRRIIGLRRVKILWAILFLAYFIIYSYLQGVIVIDPAWRLEPTLVIFQGTVGYGPVIVWSPGGVIGFVFRAYLFSAALTLSFSASLVLTLFLLMFLSRWSIKRVLPAPLTGFAVLCPTCFTSPAAAIILTFISLTTPIPIFSILLMASTTLLIISLTLIWIALSLLSRIPLVRDS